MPAEILALALLAGALGAWVYAGCPVAALGRSARGFLLELRAHVRRPDRRSVAESTPMGGGAGTRALGSGAGSIEEERA